MNSIFNILITGVMLFIFCVPGFAKDEIIQTNYQSKNQKSESSLSVKTIPQDAEIFLNGNKIGLSDITKFPADPGTYNLLLSRKGYESEKLEIDILPNGIETIVNLPLQIKKLDISFNITPPDSEIYLNNIKFNPGKIEYGKYSIRISKSDYEDYFGTVLIESNASFSFQLNPVYYSPFAAAALSLFPGGGQLYQKNYIRSALFFSGITVGIITSYVFYKQTESSYNSYKVAFGTDIDKYYDEASKFQKYYYVSLGITAGLYVFGIIESALSADSHNEKFERNRIASGLTTDFGKNNVSLNYHWSF